MELTGKVTRVTGVGSGRGHAIAKPFRQAGTHVGLAQAAFLLASDDNSFVTGATYCVDGVMVRFSQPV